MISKPGQLWFDWYPVSPSRVKQEEWMKALHIHADTSEGSSGIPALLKEYGVQVRTAPLQAGDYWIQNKTLVERKTAADFVNSLYKGRLFEQLKTGKKNASEFLFVVEGGQWVFDQIKPAALQGALLTILLSWKIPVIFTKNKRGTVQLLLATGKRNLRQTEKRLVPLGRKKKSHTKFQSQLRILENLPEIGPHLARKLLAKFGTVENVIHAEDVELQSIKGVGKLKAQKIHWAVHESAGIYKSWKGFLKN